MDPASSVTTDSGRVGEKSVPNKFLKSAAILSTNPPEISDTPAVPKIVDSHKSGSFESSLFESGMNRNELEADHPLRVIRNNVPVSGELIRNKCREISKFPSKTSDTSAGQKIPKSDSFDSSSSKIASLPAAVESHRKSRSVFIRPLASSTPKVRSPLRSNKTVSAKVASAAASKAKALLHPRKFENSKRPQPKENTCKPIQRNYLASTTASKAKAILRTKISENVKCPQQKDTADKQIRRKNAASTIASKTKAPSHPKKSENAKCPQQKEITSKPIPRNYSASTIASKTKALSRTKNTENVKFPQSKKSTGIPILKKNVTSTTASKKRSLNHKKPEISIRKLNKAVDSRILSSTTRLLCQIQNVAEAATSEMKKLLSSKTSKSEIVKPKQCQSSGSRPVSTTTRLKVPIKPASNIGGVKVSSNTENKELKQSKNFNSRIPKKLKNKNCRKSENRLSVTAVKTRRRLFKEEPKPAVRTSSSRKVVIVNEKYRKDVGSLVEKKEMSQKKVLKTNVKSNVPQVIEAGGDNTKPDSGIHSVTSAKIEVCSKSFPQTQQNETQPASSDAMVISTIKKDDLNLHSGNSELVAAGITQNLLNLSLYTPVRSLSIIVHWVAKIFQRNAAPTSHMSKTRVSRDILKKEEPPRNNSKINADCRCSVGEEEKFRSKSKTSKVVEMEKTDNYKAANPNTKSLKESLLYRRIYDWVDKGWMYKRSERWRK